MGKENGGEEKVHKLWKRPYCIHARYTWVSWRHNFINTRIQTHSNWFVSSTSSSMFVFTIKIRFESCFPDRFSFSLFKKKNLYLMIKYNQDVSVLFRFIRMNVSHFHESIFLFGFSVKICNFNNSDSLLVSTFDTFILNFFCLN